VRSATIISSGTVGTGLPSSAQRRRAASAACRGTRQARDLAAVGAALLLRGVDVAVADRDDLGSPSTTIAVLVMISSAAVSGIGCSPKVAGNTTELAIAALDATAICAMKATSKIVIMSIIGMMLRWRISSPSGPALDRLADHRPRFSGREHQRNPVENTTSENSAWCWGRR
jgi:hypothetical protein